MLIRVVVILHWVPIGIESTDGVFTGGTFILVDLMSAIVFWRTAVLLFNRSTDVGFLHTALLDRGAFVSRIK